MKTYKVIALSVGGLGNKIFSSGDTVVEGNFKAGRADELVAKGFLRLIDSSAEVIETPIAPIIKDEVEAVKTLDEVSKAELIAELTERGVDFDATANKKTLYALWIKK